MKKIIIAGTMIFLVAVMMGTAFTQDILLQAFASSDNTVQILRAVLVVFLGALLLTSPPRSVYFRYALGATAALIGTVALGMFASDRMLALDALVFIETVIIFVIEAIEAPVAATSAPKKLSTENMALKALKS